MPLSSLILSYFDPTGGLPPSMWGMFLASLLAAVATFFTVLKIWGRQLWWRVKIIFTRHGAVPAVVLVSVVAGILMGVALFRRQPASTPPRPAPGAARVLVLGLDGLDPQLVDRYMSEGRLPNLAQLAKEGVYHTLSTTTPPQSPVAWASFITGHEPLGAEGHGIFDFIRRNPRNYLPDLSIANRKKLEVTWRGEPFWNTGAINDEGLTAIRLPLTFPPPKLNGRLLAGMGVWDVRGTEGTYFFYSSEPVKIDDPHGMILDLKADENTPGVWRGELPGPYVAGKADEVREGFEVDVAKPQAELRVQGKSYALNDGRWSDWISVEFRFGAMGLQKVRAITRAILHRPTGENKSITLYVSPLNFDPTAPLYAISYPRDYSGELFDAIGPYHTRGMPFDSQAVNDGVLSDADFLQQCQTITDETDRMLTHELTRFDAGMLFAYFESPDMIQHMFWRCMDPESPLYNTPDAAANRDTIPNHYQQLDAIVGRARAALADHGTLVVISDHGFAPFRKAVHLNSILRELGYLKLKEGQTSSPEFFKNVDWSRTQAYALGLNAVYVNTAGREGQGIVPAQDAPALARKIAAEIEQFKVGEERPVKKVYVVSDGGENAPDLIVGYFRNYRASWETGLGGVPEKLMVPNDKKWSGDHCIDSSEVPGVFFSSDAKLDAAALMNVGAAIGKYLGDSAQAAAPPVPPGKEPRK